MTDMTPLLTKIEGGALFAAVTLNDVWHKVHEGEPILDYWQLPEERNEYDFFVTTNLRIQSYTVTRVGAALIVRDMFPEENQNV